MDARVRAAPIVVPDIKPNYDLTLTSFHYLLLIESISRFVLEITYNSTNTDMKIFVEKSCMQQNISVKSLGECMKNTKPH